ncbi:MAG: hypothetical protein N2234_10810 [Planctomycetota bacterium]|nr:hypothetical protein [Planctomycetota bacterium]
MFRMLLSLWRSKDLLSESFDIFKEMLEDVEWMFDMTTDVLLCKKREDEIEKEIRKREKAVDKAEMEIRRKVIEHLSIKGEDIPASLVLFSVVKDAERIGDLCIDILSAAHFATTTCPVGILAKHMEKLETSLESMFSKTRNAFLSSDDETAKGVMVLYEETKRDCDKLLDAVLKETSITLKDAVSYALISVYFRRVAAHIHHIAASIINPQLTFEHTDEE